MVVLPIGVSLRIGVFDSGVGGLTVFSALHDALPHHDLIYLGDTARVPYGTRSAETVVRYSCRVASCLAEMNIDALVIACNTATTYALDTLQEAGKTVGIRVFGVIKSGVESALANPETKRLAVIGTPGTIAGGIYQNTIQKRNPSIEVVGIACPLFVPLAEEGWTQGEVPEKTAEIYLGHLRGNVDTVILGCTHYPLLTQVIQSVLPGVRLVDSAAAIATRLQSTLPQATRTHGTRAFYVTDHVRRFESIGTQFLGWKPDPIQWIDLGPANPPFTI